MRVAMVVPSRGFYGGIERHAHDLSRGLEDRGHAIILVHGELEGRDEDAYAAPFEAVVPRRAASTLEGVDVVYAHRAASADELAVFGATPAIVVSHDHDLTCVRSHRYLPVGLEPCHRPPGVACVRHGCVVVRDRRTSTPLPVQLRSPFALRRRLHHLAARARIVTCSGYVRDRIVEAGVPLERTHVIHSIPPEDPRPPTPRPTAPRLLVAGNLLRGKGVDIAIDALAHLPAEMTLTVVGDGPSRAELEAQAARAAPGRVHFVGWVPPAGIAEHYDAASVVLVPSRWPEPFGMVGIEAMRRARPVVAPHHGGIPEWATGTSGAQTYAPGDARALARAALSLHRDRAAGIDAARHARTRFPHRRLLDEVEALIHRVAAERAA